MKNHYSQHLNRARTLTPMLGFTLIELMVAVIIVGILSAVAIPNYSRYVQRTRVSDALAELSKYRLSMEQASQDNGNYGVKTCAVAVPAETAFFTTACALENSGTTFTATATGKGSMDGYTFTIDNLGNRKTTAYPGVTGEKTCWLTSPGGC